MERSNATGEKTVLVTQPSSVVISVTVGYPGTYRLTLRYSNDGPESPPDIASVVLKSGAAGALGEMRNTRVPGQPPGTGWNEFNVVDLGVIELEEGENRVELRVTKADSYGVELDSLTIDPPG